MTHDEVRHHKSSPFAADSSHCTPALTHEEAIQALQVKNTWNDEKLYVRPVGHAQ
jgi:hypothetical protein